LLDFEKQGWEAGALRIAGVDEAGRGPLAGPVCAAAVVFDSDFLVDLAVSSLKAITDSKQLSEKRREELYQLLTSNSHIEYGIALVESADIDRLNILAATSVAMARALGKIAPPPDLALVDGNLVQGLPCPAKFIVKGDAKSLSIAAASIIAKVHRDRIMVAMDREYPQYGFAAHKGYGTPEHLDAIKKHGATPQHRRTFKPVREVLDPPWDFQ